MPRGVPRSILAAVATLLTCVALVVAPSVLTLLPQPAAAATRGQSRAVTSLRVRDATAAEAYAALAEQAGVAVDFDPSAAPSADVRLSLRVIQEPFWAALTAINGPADMHVDSVQRQPALRVRVVPTRDQPGRKTYFTSVDGPFLAELTSLPRSSEQALGLKPGATAPQLLLRLCVEPAMRALLWYDIKVDELIDDSGRALEYSGLGHTPLPFERGTTAVLFRLAPRPAPLRIARMKLSGTVLAAVRSEVAEVTRLADGNPAAVSAAGFRIEVSSLPGERGPLLKINLTRTAANGPDWLKPASRLRLLDPVVVDATDRRIPSRLQSLNWSGRTGSMLIEVDPPPARAAGQHAGAGVPHRLMLEIPTEVAEYDTRLEFSEIQLR